MLVLGISDLEHDTAAALFDSGGLVAAIELRRTSSQEAYAAGKPVVGSRLESLPWVIEENKSGLLLEPGSVDDLVKTIEYLLNRPDEVGRMGKYARLLV